MRARGKNQVWDTISRPINNVSSYSCLPRFIIPYRHRSHSPTDNPCGTLPYGSGRINIPLDFLDVSFSRFRRHKNFSVKPKWRKQWKVRSKGPLLSKMFSCFPSNLTSLLSIRFHWTYHSLRHLTLPLIFLCKPYPSLAKVMLCRSDFLTNLPISLNLVTLR